MGGMASTPQNTSKIDFLRMSLPCACRLYGSSLLKRVGSGERRYVSRAIQRYAWRRSSIISARFNTITKTCLDIFSQILTDSHRSHRFCSPHDIIARRTREQFWASIWFSALRSPDLAQLVRGRANRRAEYHVSLIPGTFFF